MAEKPVDTAILGLTAQIVSAHAANNELGASSLLGAGPEIGLPGLHCLPGRRETVEDAQAASFDIIQHDS